MRATIMHKAGDVRIETVPDAAIREPTDALIRVTRACICGSDLWPYNDLGETPRGQPMGHEAIGVVEDVGRDVQQIRRGQVVIMPFALFGRQLRRSVTRGCTPPARTAASSASMAAGGAQAEALRIPHADGTLYAIDVGEDDALMPSPAHPVGRDGHRPPCGGLVARRGPGKTAAVVGDGAVGLCGVIAAKRLGAERIIIMGRHDDRIALAREFGATDVVTERGEAAIERGAGADRRLRRPLRARMRRLRAGDGDGAGHRPAGRRDRPGRRAALRDDPRRGRPFFRNIIIGGGPAPARAYIDELLPDVMEGRIEPGRVFDRTVDLDGVPDGYRAMNDREAIKVLVRP